MNNIISKIKTEAGFFYRNLLGYLADLASALIGRTRKQANHVSDLLDELFTRTIQLTLENQRLQKRIDELESGLKKPSKTKASSKKKASPKKGQ